MQDFISFPKIPRLSRECIITEKLDGTNASVVIQATPLTVFKDDGPLIAETNGLFIYAGSRNRWITPADDNYGFAKWVKTNADELSTLGPGQHFGEWWGQGIQRNYGLKEKRFSLFNVTRWCLHGQRPAVLSEPNPKQAIAKLQDILPPCVGLVPLLLRDVFHTDYIEGVLADLADNGSKAAPGFMKPEGIIIYHVAGNYLFKKTIEHDERSKHSP